MTTTVEQLFPNATYTNYISSSAASIYDVAGADEVHITGITANNEDTANITVYLYLIPTGGSVTNDLEWARFTVLPGTPFVWAVNKLIPVGYSLYAKASTASKLTMFIDGYVVR